MVWFLEPESLNIGYLDPLGYGLSQVLILQILGPSGRIVSRSSAFPGSGHSLSLWPSKVMPVGLKKTNVLPISAQRIQTLKPENCKPYSWRQTIQNTKRKPTKPSGISAMKPFTEMHQMCRPDLDPQNTPNHGRHPEIKDVNSRSFETLLVLEL